MSLCRVCTLSSLPGFLPVMRALRVLGSVLYPQLPFCFLPPFSTNLVDTYVTVPIDVHIHVRLCLNSFSIYIFISLNHAHVYVHMYTHFPPLPYSYTSIAIFICTVCVVFYTYTHVFVYFLLFPKLNRHLCHGVYGCNIPLLISYSSDSFCFLHSVICVSTIIRSSYIP